MALVNEHFLKLPGNYLFADIAKRVNAFKVSHPKVKVISLGIGDVTRPLAPVVIEASTLISMRSSSTMVPRATPETSRKSYAGTTISA